MNKEHRVIIISGLDDRTAELKVVTNNWKYKGLMPVVHSMDWRDGKPFSPKLQRLVDRIDELSEVGDVSLVGTSAGGSAALNAFLERSDVLERVVSVCGRLRKGQAKGMRGFDRRKARSRAFGESIELLEEREDELTIAERRRIMTVRAKFGDQAVPPDTAEVYGALNVQIPTFEHVFSIGASLSVFSKPVVLFLNGRDR